MDFEEFRKLIRQKFEETIAEDREEATKHFGSKRNAYLHGWRQALDYVKTEMDKVESAPIPLKIDFDRLESERQARLSRTRKSKRKSIK